MPDDNSLEAWQEVLEEPMTSVRDEGWTVVRSVEDISPRPQSFPARLPALDTWVSTMTPQPEAETEDRLPASLADQLSLTWSIRRARQRQHDAEEVSEAATVQPLAGREPEEATRRPPTWTRPLSIVSRLISRRRDPEPTAEPPAETQPAADEAPPPASATSPRERESAALPPKEEQPTEDAPPPERDRPPRLPLVLHQPELTQEPPSAAQTTEVPAVQTVAQTPVRPAGRFETLLARATRRTRPPATLQPAAADAPPKPVARQIAPAPPLVHRLESATPEPATPEAVMIPTSAQPDDVAETLSPVLKERMEGLVDVRLGDVRIFRSPRSEAVTRSLSADAVSAGQEVHFAPGKGMPGTASGEALLAHELSHVASTLAPPPLPAAGAHEEAHALKLEHTALRRSMSLAADLPSPGSGPSPRSMDAPAAAGPRTVSLAAPAATAADQPRVARADSARLPAATDPVAAPDDRESGLRSGAEPARERSEEDTQGLVDRIVETVLRRLRRESELDRERRGVFRSEIGG